MIGTHNSCTGYPPVHKIYNLFKFLWKCQDKTLLLQAKDGVKYFDIRVRYTNGRWQCCHGIVDVLKYYYSLEEPLLWGYVNGYKIRLILERGDPFLFKCGVERLAYKYSNLVFAAIKNNWEVLINKDPKIIELYWTPFLRGKSFILNIKRLFNIGIRNIKEYAVIHNLTLDIAKEGDNVYLMDYYELNRFNLTDSKG